MTKEDLILTGVKHAFNGQRTVFKVESLHKHFDGLVIHESDLLTDEFEDQDEAYVALDDVNFDSAVAKEVAPEKDFTIEVGETVLEEGHFSAYTGLRDNGYEIGDTLVYEEEKPWYKKEIKIGLDFLEAEKILDEGNLIALPEWEGFWFKNLINGQLLVFTKDGEVLDTPHDEYKLRTDWVRVDATEEQSKVLESYFDDLSAKSIKVEDAIIENDKEESKSVAVSSEDQKEEETKTSARKDFETKTKTKK